MFHLLCLSYHSFQCFTCSASFIIVFSVSLVRPLAVIFCFTCSASLVQFSSMFHLLRLSCQFSSQCFTCLDSCPVLFSVSLTRFLLSSSLQCFTYWFLLSSSLQCFNCIAVLFNVSLVRTLLSSSLQCFTCSTSHPSLQCFTCSAYHVQFSSMFHLSCSLQCFTSLASLVQLSSVFHLFGLLLICTWCFPFGCFISLHGLHMSI